MNEHVTEPDIQPANDVELSVVVPIYQEETGIGPYLQRVIPVLQKLTGKYEIIFCMDPGKDSTEGVVLENIQRNPRIRLIVMTRRWGQPAATMAGIEHCSGKACVIMDVDLQDPPELIEDFYQKWKEGYDVVYAQRRTRKGENLHHRICAYIGYWLVNRISEIPIPRNTGDFRLMDRKVVDKLKEMKEVHGYLRGLVPYVGFKQTGVQFDRDPRATGRSNYGPIIGDVRIIVNSLVAFSFFPLQLASLAGISLLLISAMLFFILLIFLISGHHFSWPMFFMIAFLMIEGFHFVFLGILGEYLGRAYEEARGRPKYFVDKLVNF